jgi:hypothetical protein
MADHIDTLAQCKARALTDEARHIRAALIATHGNLFATARLLAVTPPSTLQRVLERHPELIELRTELRKSVDNDTPTAHKPTHKRRTGSRIKHKTSISR